MNGCEGLPSVFTTCRKSILLLFFFEMVLGGLHLPRTSSLHKDAMWTLVLGGRGRELAHPGHLPQVRNPLKLMVLLPVSP